MGFSSKYFDFSSTESSCATESLGEREKTQIALTLDFMIRQHDGMQRKRRFKNTFAFFRSYRDYSNSLSLSLKQANPPGVVEASNVINDPKCNKGPKCNNFWP